MTCPRVTLPLVLFAVALGWLTSCTSDGFACDERLPNVRPGVCLTPIEARPDAPLETGAVLGDESRQLGVGDFVGDVVVVNFWASWCGPCRREQPELNAARDLVQDLGVSFMGVDLQENLPTNGLVHQEEFAIPYESIYDPSSRYASLYRGIGRQTVPSTVFIDREGRVAVTIYGEVLGDEVVTLATMLAEEA